MKDYEYISQNYNNEIADPMDWLRQFLAMTKALGASIYENGIHGKYKDMGVFIEDLTIAGMKYYRENGDIKLGKNVE